MQPDPGITVNCCGDAAMQPRRAEEAGLRALLLYPHDRAAGDPQAFGQPLHARRPLRRRFPAPWRGPGLCHSRRTVWSSWRPLASGSLTAVLSAVARPRHFCGYPSTCSKFRRDANQASWCTCPAHAPARLDERPGTRPKSRLSSRSGTRSCPRGPRPSGDNTVARASSRELFFGVAQCVGERAIAACLRFERTHSPNRHHTTSTNYGYRRG
jgi:hypothetical protein